MKRFTFSVKFNLPAFTTQVEAEAFLAQELGRIGFPLVGDTSLWVKCISSDLTSVSAYPERRMGKKDGTRVQVKHKQG